MPPRTLLHLGAHRTATTSFQKYLTFNKQALVQQGIVLCTPPAVRLHGITQDASAAEGLIISDENLLGTMEDNIWRQSLYPTPGKFLKRIDGLRRPIDVVYLTLRNPVDYWTSAISYCLQEGTIAPPAPRELGRIYRSERTWSDVVADLRALFPDALIHTYDFEWKLQNPKRRLVDLTGWDAVKRTKNYDIHANESSAPSGKRGTVLLPHHNPGPNEATLTVDRAALSLFSPEEIQSLDARYQQDMRTIAQMAGVKLRRPQVKDSDQTT